jgi:hypothetical protein
LRSGSQALYGLERPKPQGLLACLRHRGAAAPADEYAQARRVAAVGGRALAVEHRPSYPAQSNTCPLPRGQIPGCFFRSRSYSKKSIRLIFFSSLFHTLLPPHLMFI